MAEWNKLRSRGNVEDRRGFGPAFGGGLGLTGIAVLLLMNYLGGGDIGDVLGQLAQSQTQSNVVNTQEYEGEDEYEVFASTVLGSVNEMWEQKLSAQNKTYTPPALVLFRGATQSACGGAQSYVGPHYCLIDETIYLDETFFDELQKRFGGSSGDVAQAYVIGHEVGHHVQHKLGVVNNNRTNEESVALELQADCFAGLWANSIKDLEVFSPGEIKEAIDAAAAVGDDNIQKSSGGRVNPETWTHGSSEARVASFMKGFETGDLNACGTVTR